MEKQKDGVQGVEESPAKYAFLNKFRLIFNDIEPYFFITTKSSCNTN